MDPLGTTLTCVQVCPHLGFCSLLQSWLWKPTRYPYPVLTFLSPPYHFSPSPAFTVPPLPSLPAIPRVPPGEARFDGHLATVGGLCPYLTLVLRPASPSHCANTSTNPLSIFPHTHIPTGATYLRFALVLLSVHLGRSRPDQTNDSPSMLVRYLLYPHASTLFYHIIIH